MNHHEIIFEDVSFFISKFLTRSLIALQIQYSYIQLRKDLYGVVRVNK